MSDEPLGCLWAILVSVIAWVLLLGCAIAVVSIALEALT